MNLLYYEVEAAMAREDLIAQWKAEEAQPFEGWDFSYLAGRMFEESPPWDYMTRAAQRMDAAQTVLDMGTGGGERLLSLREHWPARVVATEEYPPNVTLARERLALHGADVVDTRLTRTDPMPFEDGEFDLVLNRHSAFNSEEVARILSVGGVFLTKQVHGMWGHDLMAEFGAKPQWPDSTGSLYVPMLESAGLQVVAYEEWEGRFGFTDIGALVYYLKAVPWMVPDFSVDRYADDLIRLHDRLAAEGRLAFWAGTYLIEAHK
jgi:SAM-dependent methyltransferase